VSNATPSIPLFGDAYLADTRHLSLEEHGAYLQLMMIAWRIDGCCLPDDDARLARMLGITLAKWKKLKPPVMAFWTIDNGVWKQGRLSKERDFVEQKRAKNKEAAEYRWNNQSIENKQNAECERTSERNAPPPPPIKKEEVRDKPSLTRARETFPRPDFAEPQVWTDFLANRKRKRLQNTATAYAGFLRDIERLTDDDWPPGRLLEHAVAKGWGGIYDPREQQSRNGNLPANSLRGSRPDPSFDLWRQANDELEAERRDQGDNSGTWPALPTVRPS
jgi:uncharacterized protein YdaU (DUF1376 family)